jgi:hypothetical protein
MQAEGRFQLGINAHDVLRDGAHREIDIERSYCGKSCVPMRTTALLYS